MTPAEIFDDFRSAFKTRKFTASLLVAFIDFVVEPAVPALALVSLEDRLAR